MVVDFIFGHTALVNGHRLDLLDVVMLIGLPAVIMPFQLDTTVLQSLLMGFAKVLKEKAFFNAVSVSK